MTRVVWVVEVEVYDPALPGTATKYYATKGFATIGTDTPADTHVDERVKQPLQINRTMFAPNTTRGRSTVGVGDITLVNGDGELDAFTTYGVDGRTVTVRKGTEGAAYPSGYPVYWTGTMQGVEVTQEFVFLKIRDRLAELNVPLQTTKYTGGGLGTLEGTEDTLKGKPKPICYGVVRNIAPPCVETAKLIYQVADAAMNSIDAVYDRGVALLQNYPDLYIAGGSSATLSDSANGTSWGNGPGSMPTNTSVVRYLKNQWVVGTDAGNLRTSRDGVTFTDRDSAAGFDTDTLAISGIAYGGGKLGAAGEAGRLTYSEDDGETWTQVFGGPWGTSDITALHYAGGLWLVAWGECKIAFSPDLLAWTIATTPAASGRTIETFCFSGSAFVAAGGGVAPLIFSSATAETWTSRTTPVGHSGTYLGSAHDGTQFCLVGASSTGTAPIVGTSADGTTWAAQTSDVTTERNDVAWDGAQFVSVGGGVASPFESIETSPDGATWTARADTANQDLFSIAFGQGGTADSYASSADLLDNALAPPAGKFKPFLNAAGSYFRLGATPDGLITADVTQGAAASDRTTAQVWEAILDERGGMASGDWNATDVTALDAANNDVIGYWTDQEARVADVIDKVKDSAGAASFIDVTGDFRIKQFLAPSGSAVLSITANDLLKPLRRILPSEQGQGIPQYRTILRYQKNYTPQTTDVAASVTDARRAFLAKEWREIADTDATVQTKHLLAIESIEETLLDVAADATTEADRRQTLRGTTRQMFELWLQLNDDTDTLELNDVVDITHSRYGLSGGELARIIGLNVNVEKREIAAVVWL